VSSGKQYDKNIVTVAELIKPSIFDNDYIKELKSVLTDMSLKYSDCDEEEKNHVIMDEMKKAAVEESKKKEEEFSNFGKPMANSEQFKDVTSIIKIGKKRKLDEITDPQL
jgi:hypothetical protein